MLYLYLQRKLEEDVTDGSRQQQTTKKRFPYTMVAPYFRSSFGSVSSYIEVTCSRKVNYKMNINSCIL